MKHWPCWRLLAGRRGHVSNVRNHYYSNSFCVAVTFFFVFWETIKVFLLKTLKPFKVASEQELPTRSQQGAMRLGANFSCSSCLDIRLVPKVNPLCRYCRQPTLPTAVRKSEKPDVEKPKDLETFQHWTVEEMSFFLWCQCSKNRKERCELKKPGISQPFIVLVTWPA